MSLARGTTVLQRGGTNATFLNNPSADTPSGLFLGFDLLSSFLSRALLARRLKSLAEANAVKQTLEPRVSA